MSRLRIRSVGRSKVLLLASVLSLGQGKVSMSTEY